jgi:CheY-like chemotaxis protein
MDYTQSGAGMNRKKILVVDGNAHDREALSMKLAGEPYDVLTAEDGAAAMSAVRSQKPDLILLNIAYPPDVGHGGGVVWDGFLLMDWLRRTPEAEATPMVLMTEEDAAKHRDHAKAAGALGLFQKPINQEGLLALIRRILG